MLTFHSTRKFSLASQTGPINIDLIMCDEGFQFVLVVKNPPSHVADVRHVGSIAVLGRSPGEGNGYPLQYSCLENSMDQGA